MFGSLRQRGGTIVVAAIVGAVAAGSPAVAAEVVAFAKSAGNANTVNKIGASKTPRAGMLVPLNAKGQFPAAVIPASRQAIGKAGPAGPQGARAERSRQDRMERTARRGRRETQEPQVPTGRKSAQDSKGRRVPRRSRLSLAYRRQPRTAGHCVEPLDASSSTIIAEQWVSRIAFRRRRRRAMSNGGCRLTPALGHGSHLREGPRRRHHELLAGWRGPSDRSTAMRRDEQNAQENIPTIVVSTSGMHTLRVRTDDKNAASSNYFGYLVWLRLVKQ